MKRKAIRVMGRCLFPALFFALCCPVVPSRAGEIERIMAIDETIAAAKTPQESVRNQVKNHKPFELRLGRTPFDPLGESPPQEETVRKIESYGEGETGYYIVQFDGPVQAAWKEGLSEAGDIFDYIPRYAFIVRLDPGKEEAVRALPHVRWVGIFQPSYRIDRRCLDRARTVSSRGDGDASVVLRASVFPGEDLDRISSEITALGGTVTEEMSTQWRTSLKVTVPRDRVGDLPGITGVRWVEPWPERRLHNDRSTDLMGVRTPRDTHGLYGEGQTVGVCDTGLDRGSADPGSLHDDFEDGSGGTRVTTIIDCVGYGDGADDVNSGHGTHVAGSVLGNGRESGSDPSVDSFPATCFAGMAPKARLVFQAVENNTSKKLEGIPWVLTPPLRRGAGGGGRPAHQQLGERGIRPV